MLEEENTANPYDLLGRPMRDLRLSVIDRCNFRCTYCMPEEEVGPDFPWLGHDERLSFDEMLRLVRQFVRLGVEKIRLTGGEPLLRTHLPELIQGLRAIPGIRDIAMTTNGVLLPRCAADLKSAGLDRVTVSMDALDETIFRRMNGGINFPEQVLDGFPSEPAFPVPVYTVFGDDRWLAVVAAVHLVLGFFYRRSGSV